MRRLMMRLLQPKWGVGVALALLACALIGESFAANCNVTTVNKVPINDLGKGLYLNQFQGGLYPNGSNIMPAAHALLGEQRAAQVQPLTPQGQSSPTGRYVLLSLGMSNTTQEFSRFMQIAATNPQVNRSFLRIIDGAAGGQVASSWDSPNDANYDRIRDQVLGPQGLSEAQVQAAWVKMANASPSVSLPNSNSDAYTLLGQLGNIVRAMKVRYPNIKVVFLSSRIYAGYATGVSTLNPEPYAYETGFACKWLIQAQIQQMSTGEINPIAGNLSAQDGPGGVAPWVAWGPYLWADGLNPRSDGLIWQCSDLSADGTHPSDAGRTKVANLLLNFFLNSPHTQRWFRHKPGDTNGDGYTNVDDLFNVINRWGVCPQPCPPSGAGNCLGDVAPSPLGNCSVNIDDLFAVISNWG
jgi:hypothetical protein